MKTDTSTRPLSPLLSAYRRLAGRLHQAAYRLTGRSAEAEDSVQEAFCRLWSRREAISNDREAAALLTTTVRHVAIDAWRRQQTLPDTMVEAATAVEPATDDDGPTPEEREDLFDEVQALINEQLTPTARYVLSHHDYCGESVADIAAHLGTSETAVRMHLSRARRAIRECYHKRHHQTP